MFDDYYDRTGRSKPALEAKRLEHVAGLFKALSDPLRLKIYEAIFHARTAGMTVGDLVEHTGAPQPLVSFHVKKLVNAELILPLRPGQRRNVFQVHGTSLADIYRWHRSLNVVIQEEIDARIRGDKKPDG
jgi:DNA-binding transcriptional ArsR family regulator